MMNIQIFLMLGLAAYATCIGSNEKHQTEKCGALRKLDQFLCCDSNEEENSFKDNAPRKNTKRTEGYEYSEVGADDKPDNPCGPYKANKTKRGKSITNKEVSIYSNGGILTINRKEVPGVKANDAMVIEWDKGVLKVNGKIREGFDEIRGKGCVELGSNSFMDYADNDDYDTDEDEHPEMSDDSTILGTQNINADFSGCSLKINGKIILREEDKNVHFNNAELVFKGKTIKDEDTILRFYNIWRWLWNKLLS